MDRGILLAEDQALKAKLGSFTVPTKNGQSARVKVWYGMPDSVRETIYPFTTIDLLDVVFARDRAHSLQVVDVDWWPSTAPTFAEFADMVGMEVDPEAPYASTILFQPYDLYYQVATHTRSSRQERHLISQIISHGFAPLNSLGTLHVPADNTQRWLDNLGMTTADYIDSEQKSVFRKVFNLQISAHIPVNDPTAYFKVLKVAASLHGMDDGEEYATWEHVAEE